MTLKGLTSRLVDATAYAAVRGIVSVIQVLPMDMGDHLCRALATLLTGPMPIRERTISETLDKIYPTVGPEDARRLTLAMWHHLMLMVCEIAWAQRRLHRSNWTEHVSFRGNREMLQASFSPRASVLVSGHFGNFEIGSYTLGLMGLKTLAIARNLDNIYLHRWVERFRGAKGQRLVDKNGCAPIVEQFMQEGGTLSLLADQHAGDKGLWVDFCGVPASCHKALALFSLANVAPMLAVYTRRVDGRPMQFESALMDMVDPGVVDAEGNPPPECESVETLTGWYNRQLERIIDLSPEQYWWLHRRWRTPSPRVAKRLAKKREATAQLRAAG
ncbi:lysophospholipid acyltransferase family protein [Aporhodopirellula aestuarii]|uniref:Lysophospholipid acyltransferase family protein n=1 Tax=Aporhodopirellula aestuarii TaxID=2950107 RepID=A0ABT0TZS4_9BACT|nr:lysophospholipid acyltransferase family protein [Aporhodopirellula aestuarii]MCM2370077.1 lysophospholipid acyltransferase family protein [Aporhodopirellula aestuarii]